jgi:drug/metabolite transporter (DMT)-like permease
VPGYFPPMHSRRLVALVSLILLMILWGTTFLVTKESVRDFPPFTLGTLRFLIATVVLGSIGILRSGRAIFRRPVPLGQLLLLTVSGISLFIVALNYAMLWGSVTQAALIYALVPAAVAIGAVLVLKETLSLSRIVGIVLSIAGVALVVAFGGRTAAAPHPLLAAVAMLVVVAGWAVYTIVAKRVASADQVVVMTWVMGTGALMLLPFSLWEVGQGGWPSASARGWLGVLFLGVVASGLAYLLYNWTLRHLETSVVGVLSNLDPIVGVASAVIFLGEVLTGWQIVGGVAALGGMALASIEGDRVRYCEARRGREM